MGFKNMLPTGGKAGRMLAWLALSEGRPRARGARERQLILFIRPSALGAAASWFVVGASVSVAYGDEEDAGSVRITPSGSWPVTRSGGTANDDTRAVRLVLPVPDNATKQQVQDVACEIEARSEFIDFILPAAVLAAAPALAVTAIAPPAQATPSQFRMGHPRLATR